MAYMTYSERLDGAPTKEEQRLAAYNTDKAALEGQISTAGDQKTLLACYEAVKEFRREYGQEYACLELKQSLLARIEAVLEQSAGEEADCIEEANKLQSQDFPDSPEEIQRMNTQADQKLLEFYSQLGTNDFNNKTVVSRAIKQATEGDGNRVTATAPLKLMQNPSYKPYFASTDKERILTASRSPLWRELDKQRNKALEEIGKKRAAAIMRSFHVKHLRDIVGRM